MKNDNELSFKKLKKIEISEKYLEWLNNKDIRRFSTSKTRVTFESQKKYLKCKLNSKSNIIFKIFYQKNHIGMLEIAKINKYHKHCEINYLIGEKSLWNKKLGTKTVSFAINYAKKILKLEKMLAGCFITNKASAKVLINNGFKKESIIKKWYLDPKTKKRVDHLWFVKNLK